MTKPKILLVTPSFQSFVQEDMRMLSERYELIVNTYNWQQKIFAPFYLFAQCLHILTTIHKVRFVFIHFGGYWSFFPALFGHFFGKPVYIVLHGTDSAAIPDLNYGSLRIPLLKWFCRKSYEWATLLLPVSESLIRTESNFLQKEKPVKNGILYHFPDLKTPIKVIPNGFNVKFWTIDTGVIKENQSFMAVLSAPQFTLKGGDLILELAKRLKSCSFLIVGMEKPIGLSIPDNLRFTGTVSSNQLRAFYHKSRFYFQLSSFEGFGCALCEAMLCGCIPVVSNVNILPEITDNHGIILVQRDINLLEKIVKNLLNSPVNEGEKELVRKAIADRYDKENRKKLLFDLLPY